MNAAQSRSLRLPLGLLYSRTGSYGRMGARISDAAQLAVEEINAAQEQLQIDIFEADPGGTPAAYADACKAMQAAHGVRHFVGCYTSAARKWVLPWLERNDALLWHPARYEGFEADEHVIYVGAAPNQHIVPLAIYTLSNIGNRIACIGTDYIWTWETGRIMREVVGAVGGRVMSEHLVPFGALDVGNLVADILQQRPDAVFNTLVGESSYEFFRSWAVATKDMNNPPVILSCSICEAELRMIGGTQAAGCITSATYFETVNTKANHDFVRRFRDRYGVDSCVFSDAEAAYTATHLLARAVLRSESTEPARVREAAMLDRFDAPQGPVYLDPNTNHCFLTPRLGRALVDCSFEILHEAGAPVRPDPFLARLDALPLTTVHKPAQTERERQPTRYLRVVK